MITVPPSPLIRCILRDAVGFHGFDCSDLVYEGDAIVTRWEEEDVEWILANNGTYWTRLHFQGRDDAWAYYLELGIQSAKNMDSVRVMTDVVAFPHTYHERLHTSYLVVSKDTEWEQYVEGIMLPLFRHGKNLEEEEEMAKSAEDTDEEEVHFWPLEDELDSDDDLDQVNPSTDTPEQSALAPEE
jgi:hypothetical protein